MTELAIRENHALATLPQKIEYARFLAKSGLLPTSFREHPENVLYAYEYGEMLGLPPIAAITGIHVIEGKPSISAGLISALVRRAGHRIRVQATGTGPDAKARCQITRADDPGFTYSATWDMERAKQAGLLGKTNWVRYPEAMLKARAVSECARDACQEVLLGIRYTPDELGADDDGGELLHDGYPTLPNGQVNASQMTEAEKEDAGLMPRAQRVEHEELRRMNEPPPGAIDKLTEPDPGDPWTTPEPQPEPESAPHRVQSGKAGLDKLAKLQEQLGLDDAEEQAAILAWFAPGEWTASAAQVRQVCQHLDAFIKDADGDLAEARTALWVQYRKVHDKP